MGQADSNLCFTEEGGRGGWFARGCWHPSPPVPPGGCQPWQRGRSRGSALKDAQLRAGGWIARGGTAALCGVSSLFSSPRVCWQRRQQKHPERCLHGAAAQGGDVSEEQEGTASLQAAANVFIPARPRLCSQQRCQVPAPGWAERGGGAGGLAPTSPLLAGDAEPACIHLPAFCTLRVCGTPTSPPSSDSFQWKASCISAPPPSPSRAFSACAKTALFFWLVTRARPGGKLAHAAGAEHLTELSAFLPALLLQLQRKTRSSRPPLL